MSIIEQSPERVETQIANGFLRNLAAPRPLSTSIKISFFDKFVTRSPAFNFPRSLAFFNVAQSDTDAETV